MWLALAGVAVFVPKYHIKAVVHLVDRAGLVLPPLLDEQDEGQKLDDPFVVAARQRLRCGSPLCLPACLSGRLAAWLPSASMPACLTIKMSAPSWRHVLPQACPSTCLSS